MEFIVYTDGGCSGNRRDFGCPGGYGFVILDPAQTNICEGGGKGKDTTNNRMEMTAVIKGLNALKNILNEEHEGAKNHSCIVKTDSKYVCDNFTDYLSDWKINGWRKSKGGVVLNKDLWIKIDELTPEFQSFKFQWIKGHSNDKWNILADSIVQQNIVTKPATSQT